MVGRAKYIMEKDNCNGTYIQIESTDKHLLNRLDLAIDHVLKEFEEKEKKKEERLKYE